MYKLINNLNNNDLCLISISTQFGEHEHVSAIILNLFSLARAKRAEVSADSLTTFVYAFRQPPQTTDYLLYI